MSSVQERIAALTPKQREMLESRLQAGRVEEARARLLPRRRERDSFPLSFAQQRMWFLDQLEPGNPAYNNPLAFRLKGALDRDAVERCLNEIVARHEVLRTVFQTEEGRPVQVVREEMPVALHVIDLSGSPPESRMDEFRRMADEESRLPFDLSSGPLLRATLYKLHDEDCIVLLTLHHIVCDAWSIQILMREVATLYAAFTAGRPSPLAELPVQYADYAAWQREWLQGDALGRELTYWKERLAGTPALLELPTDRPRPPDQSFRGSRHVRVFSESLCERLKTLSRSEGVTLFVTLCAAFKTLLARYTGQTDIVVGTPVANRNRMEIEGLIGFFLNTLALRTQVTGEENFLEIVRRVQEGMLGARSHQEVPFERVVEALGVERSLSHTPVFQVMFTLVQDAGGGAATKPVRVGDIMMEPVWTENGASKFDLTVAMEEKGALIAASFEYNTDLFDEATIVRMARHFERIAAEAVRHPRRKVLELSLLAAEERRQILFDLNATEKEYEQKDKFIHELFEERAAKTPERVAVVFEDERISYGDLNRRANQLAHYLRESSVVPDVLVGVLMERSVEMVVALVAAMKAGGAYVPLDPSYPQERLQFMLQDSSAPVLLTQKHLKANLTATGARVICPDEERDKLEQFSAENPSRVVNDEGLAYVIYTSGSTGRPKGAMNTHGAIRNRLLWMQETYQLTAEDVVLQKTPFSFDVSVWEFFWPLMTGARLVVARPGGHQDSAYLVELIAREGVTTLHFVPSMLQVFLEETGLEKCRTLRRVICSGEALPFELQERFFVRLDAELHNLYGPTEAAIDVTFQHCRRKSGLRVVPIGCPIANTQMYVLDSNLEPVPSGVLGELHIGGIGLARGYLNRPELTAEKFIPNPFGSEPSSRLYKTGDVGRYLPDGSIEYIRRLDDQVKIRGHRIELGEIEAALAAHPFVRETVVTAREGGGVEKRLVAYVVGRSEATIGELRRHLQERLPAYMVPSVFVMLDALPLTPNGKLDRKALPAPDQSRPTLENSFVAPRNDVERTLAAIWAEVLGVEQLGVNDNFFELGGDSILSIQIIARANKQGLRLAPRQLFEHQTIASLALVADTAPATQAERGTVTGIVPLTPVQRWFFEQEQSEPQHFNQSVMLESRQTLDARHLERAVGALLTQHDALRLRFRRKADGWEQFNAAPSAEENRQAFSLIDLSTLPLAEQRAAIETEAGRQQASLDLQNGPLVRVVLFDAGASTHSRLLIIIHHLAVDGVSWPILLDDLQVAYEQSLRGVEIELAPKTTSFKEWAERLQEHARADETQNEMAYWLAAESVELKSLPVDDAEGVNDVASAQTVSVALDADETRALLQNAPAAYRASANDLLLTALAQTFKHWTGADTLLLDLEGHGREELFADVDLSRTVGWFTTIYPALLNGGIVDCGEALKTVKEQLRRIPRRGIGFGLLRYLGEETDALRKLRKLPRAEVVFNYLGQLDQALPQSSPFMLASESSGAQRSRKGRREHLLEVTGSVLGGQLRLALTYSGNVHRRTTVESLAAGLCANLRALIAHCLSTEAGGYTPSDFPLARLGQTQLDRLTGEHQEIEDIYPLSPIQQVMLSYALYAPHSEVGFEQMSCRLQGRLDDEAFARAWQSVMERHTILRTAFAWESLPEPMQIVRPNVALPLTRLDWRGLSDDEQEARLDAYLRADRRRGFNLAHPPLMRVALIRTGDQNYRIVWSHHHVLLDGWCVARVINEALSFYEAFARGQELHLERPRPFRDYIKWLGRQDLTQAEDFWRDTLKGFTTPTRLPGDTGPSRTSGDGEIYAEASGRLDAPTTTALQAFARQNQLTLNSILQGCWALLLHLCSEGPDVVFGATVSGRPAELDGAETMLGLFINVLPVRLRFDAEASLVSWLRTAQEQQLGVQQHHHSPLVKVQEWSEMPPPMRLFESLLVFQNYPVGQRSQAKKEQATPQLQIEGARGQVRTNYPLTLVVSPSHELDLLITYDRRRFDAATVRHILDHLQRIVETILTTPGLHLSQLPPLPVEERRELLSLKESPTPIRALREYIAPRNAFELRIAQIWQETLGLDAVGVKDNFFDLGGHSLLAIRAIGQMREAFGEDLPLTALLQGGTVEQLADLLKEKVEVAANSPVIALHTQGVKRPFFLVHPSGGHVMCYAPLARHLDAERPVYGLRALDAEEVFDTDLQSMAARHVALMRGVQAKGPYMLGGWSFGALLAYEMAQQLLRQGEEVAALVLLDITAPVEGLAEMLASEGDEPQASFDPETDEPFRLVRFIDELTGHKLHVLAGELHGMKRPEQLSFIIERAKGAGVIPTEMGLQDALRILRGYRCRRQAARNYHAEVYTGRLTLIFSEEMSDAERELRGRLYGDDPTRGWSRLTSEPPDVQLVEATHQTMVLEPQVKILAEHLRCRLDEADNIT